jgi:hypothetical protein
MVINSNFSNIIGISNQAYCDQRKWENVYFWGEFSKKDKNES